MEEGFDFFFIIFEYFIKDYNSDVGGKYVEYYILYVVFKIIVNILVFELVSNVMIYDFSVGLGMLLMNFVYVIGFDKCIVYFQDIFQKFFNLLCLNLVLNKLVYSIENVIQGNIMIDFYYWKDGDL